MATFHCNASHGTAGSAGGHCAYIFGVGKYSEKGEVVKTGWGNMPGFAPDGMAFFKAADMHEKETKKVKNRLTGEVETLLPRAYQGLTIAIPVEATDPVAWAETLADKIARGQPYAFGVHLKAGNPHLHLMMSQRTPAPGLTPEAFFSRKNKKNREMSSKNWLEDVKKNILLPSIRAVSPGYAPKMTGGKERQHRRHETEKIADSIAARGPTVADLRAEMDFLSAEISEKKPTPTGQKTPTNPAPRAPGAFEKIMARPRPVEAPRRDDSAAQAVRQARAADLTTGKIGKSSFDRVESAVAGRGMARAIAEQAVATRRASEDLLAGQRATKAGIDAHARLVWAPKGLR